MLIDIEILWLALEFPVADPLKSTKLPSGTLKKTSYLDMHLEFLASMVAGNCHAGLRATRRGPILYSISSLVNFCSNTFAKGGLLEKLRPQVLYMDRNRKLAKVWCLNIQPAEPPKL